MEVRHNFDASVNPFDFTVTGIAYLAEGSFSGDLLLLFEQGDFAIVAADGQTQQSIRPIEGLDKTVNIDGNSVRIQYGGVDEIEGTTDLVVTDATRDLVHVIEWDNEASTYRFLFSYPMLLSGFPTRLFGRTHRARDRYQWQDHDRAACDTHSSRQRAQCRA